MKPQKLVRNPVKGPHPHAAHVGVDHPFQTVAHFARGFIGKRDRENLRWARHPFGDNPGNARCENPRFAGPRPRQNERVLSRQFHRGALHGIEAVDEVKKILHGRRKKAGKEDEFLSRAF